MPETIDEGSLKWNAIKVDVPPIAEEDTDEFEDVEDIDGKAHEDKHETLNQSVLERMKGACTWLSDEIFAKFETAIEQKWGPVTQMTFYRETTEVIWKIDSCARKMFPLVFLILQILYWTSYLYVM